MVTPTQGNRRKVRIPRAISHRSSCNGTPVGARFRRGMPFRQGFGLVPRTLVLPLVLHRIWHGTCSIGNISPDSEIGCFRIQWQRCCHVLANRKGSETMSKRTAPRVHPSLGKSASQTKPAVSVLAEPSPTGKSVSDEVIRLCAYRKWETAGKPGGDGVDFWMEAERELSQAK